MAAYLVGHITVRDPDLWQVYITGVQEDSTCWCGGTQWQGHTAMRIGVSSWATTDKDVKQSLDAIIRIAAEEEPA